MTPEVLALPEERVAMEGYVRTLAEAADLMSRPWYESHAALLSLVERWEQTKTPSIGLLDSLKDLVGFTESLARLEARKSPALDPFTGRPMLERSGRRYSVGPNGIDDGGDPYLDVLVPIPPGK